MLTWGHYFAIALALVAIGLIIASSTVAHNSAAGRVFGALVKMHNPEANYLAHYDDITAPMNPTGPTDDEVTALLERAHASSRESARWASSVCSDATVWAVVLLITAIVFAFYLAYEFNLVQ